MLSYFFYDFGTVTGNLGNLSNKISEFWTGCLVYVSIEGRVHRNLWQNLRTLPLIFLFSRDLRWCYMCNILNLLCFDLYTLFKLFKEVWEKVSTAPKTLLSEAFTTIDHQGHWSEWNSPTEVKQTVSSSMKDMTQNTTGCLCCTCYKMCSLNKLIRIKPACYHHEVYCLRTLKK